MRGKTLVVQGMSFPSVLAAARHYGVSLQTAARRLREGWTPEQAFGLEQRQHAPWPVQRSKNITTSVGTFRTIQEAAARFALPDATIAARLRNGWTPDEAVGLVERNRRPKTTTPVKCAG